MTWQPRCSQFKRLDWYLNAAGHRHFADRSPLKLFQLGHRVCSPSLGIYLRMNRPTARGNGVQCSVYRQDVVQELDFDTPSHSVPFSLSRVMDVLHASAMFASFKRVLDPDNARDRNYLETQKRRPEGRGPRRRTVPVSFGVQGFWAVLLVR
jgi:hypothetical protein